MKPVDLMHPEYPVGKVDIRSLIIFPQPRKVFDEIESLKEGIEENQLFSVPVVALLDKGAFGEYIATINFRRLSCCCVRLGNLFLIFYYNLASHNDSEL